ncbi:MAG: ribbon-helix-helix protein, CopG family [Desulfovibrio sp.]|nr:ribbon-helix-helix protein, CopG family [Desulfovibrio sp.]
MHATSLRLPDDIGKRLTELAKRTGRSKTYYILEAIREHLDDLEDLYIAEQRLADIKAGRSRTYSVEEVRRELGLDS